MDSRRIYQIFSIHIDQKLLNVRKYILNGCINNLKITFFAFCFLQSAGDPTHVPRGKLKKTKFILNPLQEITLRMHSTLSCRWNTFKTCFCGCYISIKISL
jgi:hypothetical protein